MSKKHELENNAAQVLAAAMQNPDPKAQFCAIWNGTIKPVLELVKSFTGAKMDKSIEELERAADGVCSGANPDVSNFCKVWKDAHLENILKFVEVFVGKNVKKTINKFIDIVDSFCP